MVLIALQAIFIHWVAVGFGKHEDPATLSAVALTEFVVNLLYNTALTLVKLSALLFYHRLFGTTRSFRIALWITAGICLGWFIAIDFMAIFVCVPVEKYWNPIIPGHCLNQQKTFLGTAVPNIVTDLIILLLPMPMVWKLQTRLSLKIYLVFTFVAGYRYRYNHDLCDLR